MTNAPPSLTRGQAAAWAHYNSIAHITTMHNMIDRSITPDPFNPQPGDVYARTHGDGPGPRRVVVHDIQTDGDIRVIVDGAAVLLCNPPADFRRYLASIDGLEAIGRVR